MNHWNRPHPVPNLATVRYLRVSAVYEKNHRRFRILKGEAVQAGPSFRDSITKSAQASQGSDARRVHAKQPAPIIPGISASKVRERLRQMIEQGMLLHSPPTLKDWRLAEWQVGRELKVSSMRLAFFVSETVKPHNGLDRTSQMG